jgi:hypothetical protein
MASVTPPFSNCRRYVPGFRAAENGVVSGPGLAPSPWIVTFAHGRASITTVVVRPATHNGSLKARLPSRSRVRT